MRDRATEHPDPLGATGTNTEQLAYPLVGPFRLLRVELSDPRALRVREAVYVEEMKYETNSVLRDPLDEKAAHFVATTISGEPVAGMRIISGRQRPFELESMATCSELIDQDPLPAEISRLCISTQFRAVKRRQFVHAGMWKLATDYARVEGITHYWIWAPLAITAVYEYLGFSQVSGLRFCHPAFNNQMYQVLRLDVRTLHDEYRRRKHALSQLLFGDETSEGAAGVISERA